MYNNDILRRLRYTFDFGDSKMKELFSLGGLETDRTAISDWLKLEEDPAHKGLVDKDLAAFLNGLIVKNRGKKDGEDPKPEKSLNNNVILRKIKIALNMKDDDMLEVFDIARFQISKHELSAIFRKPGQSQYRECKDQFLRNFLMGLQIKHRGQTDETEA